MPSRKRITKNGHNKPYVYEVLARRGSQHPKDVVRCVGIAVDDQTMHPNENYFALHPETSVMPPLDAPDTGSPALCLGRSLLLQRISKNLGLYDALQTVFPDHTNTLLLFCEFLLSQNPPDLRLFSCYLGDHSFAKALQDPAFSSETLAHRKIRSFLQKWKTIRLSSLSLGESVDFFFDPIDSSAFTENPFLHQSDYLPPINTGLFLEHKTGLPLFFDLYHGSVLAMDHCRAALGQICADKKHLRGRLLLPERYFSQYNLSWAAERCSFISIGRRSAKLNELARLWPPEKIAAEGEKVDSSLTGFRSEDSVFPHDTRKYQIYLYYDSAYASRIDSLLKQTADMLEGESDRKGALKDLYENRLSVQHSDAGIIAKTDPASDARTYLEPGAGYFWFVSNEILSPGEAFSTVDRLRNQGFPVQTDAIPNIPGGPEALLFFSFLVLILKTELKTGLHPYLDLYPEETLQTVFAHLDKIRAISKKGVYQLEYALTEKQQQILSAFEISLEDVLRAVHALNQNEGR